MLDNSNVNGSRSQKLGQGENAVTSRSSFSTFRRVPDRFSSEGLIPICSTIGLAVRRGRRLRWYHYLAYFFGGAFLANALPHLGNGISGHAFQSPFASPPGVGLSSAMVNVLWGFFNLAIAYLLVCRAGSFNLRKTQHVLVLGAGILIMSLMLAHAFARFHGGQ